ncbi:MAG TPA: amidohydrolase family protein [Gaiellaceae bacterium]|nr:amidohydrolase family protein [Gaiellaceae bacterium]
MAPVYDVHQHLWPPALIDALRARTRPPRLRGDTLELPSGRWALDVTTHDPEARLAALDRDGVDVAVLSCPPTLELDEQLVDVYHAAIADVVAGSGGRFLALACGAVLDGFAGTCVAARTVVDLDRAAPLLSELERRGGILFVHPGPERCRRGAPAWWPAVVGYTAQMQAAYAAWIAYGAARWPNLRVVFAILAGGAPIQLERLASRGLDTRAVLHRNAFLDTASYGERALSLALSTYGVGQLVYGSDWPVIDAAPTLRAVRGFGQAVVDAVCSDTPARVLG